MRLHKLILISMALIASNQSDAADMTKPGIYGVGSVSCGVWVEQRSKPNGGQSELLVSWTMGFLTAMEANGTSYAATDKSAVIAFLDKYCKENPLMQFATAAVTLSNSLAQKYTDELNRQIEQLSGKKH